MGSQKFDNPLPRWWVYLFYATIVFSILYWFNLGVGIGPGRIAQYEAEVAAAAEVAEQIVTGSLARIYLGHLSRDCNRPELARTAVGGRLQQIGATHVAIESTSQDAPSPTVIL